ncbi:FBD-associated F-box protein At4g10400-like [Chenopodium quinoa]|uniref:FBD-associated F-box protein At4g10400-like n=1 Tax=Chenopodium quinoa TaxID=63459 RepID=UPI000B77C894|nr:FBD-associated F-box protein At4g10400-like [Chenopodium quinoa]
MNTTKLQGNKKIKHGNKRDRLSELPDELLVHILSFLPTTDAVRTVLLRRFGNLWTLIPTLTFEDPDDDEFVCNVLKHHKSPVIHRLKLCDVVGLSQTTLTKCANLASTKKTEQLLLFMEYGDLCVVPRRVFRSQHIVTLVLDGLKLALKRPVFVGSLMRLELVNVKFCKGALERVIDGCPCLKDLLIVNPIGIRGVQFTAPNIEMLMLELQDVMDFTIDCPNLSILHVEKTYTEQLQFINVSSVYYASITIPCSIPHRDFAQLVDTFPNIEVLIVGYEAYAQLRQCGNSKLDLEDNNKWVRLSLRPRVHGSCLRNIICKLLKASQCLQTLIIYANGDYFCDCNMLQRELSSPCVLKKLETITIHECEKPYKGLLQLIEFVLKSAVVLEKLVIRCSKDKLFSTEGLEFINQVSSFPTASRKKVEINIMLST